jgi:hypothetical protein
LSPPSGNQATSPFSSEPDLTVENGRCQYSVLLAIYPFKHRWKTVNERMSALGQPGEGGERCCQSDLGPPVVRAFLPSDGLSVEVVVVLKARTDVRLGVVGMVPRAPVYDPRVTPRYSRARQQRTDR